MERLNGDASIIMTNDGKSILFDLGLAGAVSVVGPRGLNAKGVLDIHSERKVARGLVPLLAHTPYPNPNEVRALLPQSLVDVHSQQKVLIS